ncbi:MAG: hypothetical protein HYT07_01125 [Candidatus Levybacteria bacterium]|nr:hypothetical protein [Candidatus Levybacteria bacterium]
MNERYQELHPLHFEILNEVKDASGNKRVSLAKDYISGIDGGLATTFDTEVNFEGLLILKNLLEKRLK